MDPEAAYLLNRGIQDAGTALAKAVQNAMAVAGFLEKHPKVARVFMPGSLRTQITNLAKKQMRGFRLHACV